MSNGAFKCGRSQEEGHQVLEFGGARTEEAAEYAPGVCQKWAYAIAEEAATDVDPEVALKDVALTEHKVKRHKSRGEDPSSKREVRDDEDLHSKAGMRNPADLEKEWPTLWRTMAKVRAGLEELRGQYAELQGLTALCGQESSRAEPSEAIMKRVRSGLADVLGVAHDEVDLHHVSAPWRHALVKAVQLEAQDPDESMAEWLRVGAPMGLGAPIEPGHLFRRWSRSLNGPWRSWTRKKGGTPITHLSNCCMGASGHQE